MPSQFEPGAVINGALPGQQYQNNLPTWQNAVVYNMLQNLRTPGNEGKPATWDESKLGSWSDVVRQAQGTPSNQLVGRLTVFVQNGMAGDDLAWATQVAGPPPPASSSDWALTPDAQAQRLQDALSAQKQNFAEAKYAIDLALKNAPPMRFASSGPRNSSGGGGGGGGGTTSAQDAQLALETRKLDLQQAFQNGQLNLQQLQLQLSRENAAESTRQFNASFAQNAASQEASNRLNRAQIVTKLSADPGDAVARNYFLQMGGESAQPKGTPTDVFTGNTLGGPQTLSELVTHQANNASPQPMYGKGSHGWVPLSKAVLGDPQVPGRPNPELLETRVGRGGVEGRITPVSEMAQERLPVPHHAAGSPLTQEDGSLAPQFTSFGYPGTASPPPNTGTFAQIGKDANGQIQFGWLNDKGQPMDAMALTGAQVSRGVTQSNDPTAPNYKPIELAAAPGTKPEVLPPSGVQPDASGNVWVDDKRAAGGGYWSDNKGHITTDNGNTWAADPYGTKPFNPNPPPPNTTKGDLTLEGPQLTLDAPNTGGYSRILSGGTVKVGAGGKAVLLGDGSEIKGPDGKFYSWNVANRRYEPVLVNPTVISTSQQWFALPPEVRQAIESGTDTSFVLNNNGINPRATGDSYDRTLAATTDPAARAKIIAQKQAAMQNPWFNGLDANRSYTGGWMGPAFDRYQMTGDSNRYSRAEFLGLPPEQQAALLNGTSTDPRSEYRTWYQDPQRPSSLYDRRTGVVSYGLVPGHGEEGTRPHNYWDYYGNDYANLPPTLSSMVA